MFGVAWWIWSYKVASTVHSYSFLSLRTLFLSCFSAFLTHNLTSFQKKMIFQHYLLLLLHLKQETLGSQHKKGVCILMSFNFLPFFLFSYPVLNDSRTNSHFCMCDIFIWLKRDCWSTFQCIWLFEIIKIQMHLSVEKTHWYRLYFELVHKFLSIIPTTSRPRAWD